ncbi:MAG: protein translocase subunit SecF [Wolbachia endosymbiont of Menacanthus eurysternus]|nr:MAG: protein translocase subunit SecF [Wolbachia endosymbiont of Menacanthus eurysternus]
MNTTNIVILDNLNIKFSKYKKWIAFISTILVMFSILFIAIWKVNLGIDFTGGILVEIKFLDKENYIIPEFRVNGLIQDFKKIGDNLIIRFKENGDKDEIKKIKKILEEKLGTSINYRKMDYIGPQIGPTQVFEGIISILIAVIGIFFYIWLRFNWRCGFGGIVALFHDIVLTVGFISLTGIEFNISSVMALFTIIGYSINNSIVIYDRIREFQRNGKNRCMNEVIDISINATLFRTVLTSGTTLLATLPLVLICTGTVKNFSLIIFFGIAIGTCSAIFISAPILTFRILK